MGYQVRLVPEVESWLVELRAGDRVLATRVDEAVEALRVAGDSLGPPMVIPLDEWPARGRPDPRQTADYSYQQALQSLTVVRRGVADVATSRRRVEVQLEQLDRQAATLGEDPGEDAAAYRGAALEQAAGLRAQHGQLLAEEKRLTSQSMHLQRKLDAFRTRTETIRASHTAAEGAARAEQVMELLEARMDEAAGVVAGEAPAPAAVPGPAGPGSTTPGQGLELYELRPGAPGSIGARILFTVAEPGDPRAGEPMTAGDQDQIAVLLAAGTEDDWLRTWYQDAVLLCRSRYRKSQSPPGGTAG